MLPEEVLKCAFPAWYPHFSKVTIRSVIVPIPDDVLLYLRSNETLVLPKECDGHFAKGKTSKPNDDNDSDEEPDAFEEDEEDEEEEEQPTFPDFSDRISSIIEDLGGRVFCKLNWSSPRDATWVTCDGSLRCSSIADVYLLLKSSEFVRHDLTQPFKDCRNSDGEELPKISYSLVLRKWKNINPSHEFRCFVKGKQLFAVSQRDGTTFFNHLLAEKDSILRDISSFFQEHVQSHFPLDDYVFDVIRSGKDVVKLMDFNPFGITTDSILFDWDQLSQNEAIEGNFDLRGICFRFVEDETGIQPNGLQRYSIPRDFVDLSTGQDHDKLIDFLKIQKNRQEREADT